MYKHLARLTNADTNANESNDKPNMSRQIKYNKCQSVLTTNCKRIKMHGIALQQQRTHCPKANKYDLGCDPWSMPTANGCNVDNMKQLPEEASGTVIQP